MSKQIWAKNDVFITLSPNINYAAVTELCFPFALQYMNKTIRVIITAANPIQTEPVTPRTTYPIDATVAATSA